MPETPRAISPPTEISYQLRDIGGTSLLECSECRALVYADAEYADWDAHVAWHHRIVELTKAPLRRLARNLRSTFSEIDNTDEASR